MFILKRKIVVIGSVKALPRLLGLAIFLLLAGCGGGSSDNAESGAGEAPATEAVPADEVAEETEEPLELKRRIVVIGDSIGAGTGASSNFPAILQGLTGIEVVNASTPGISAEAGISKAPSLIERLRPMYLVVLLGTNNAAGAGGGVSGAVDALRKVTGVARDAGVVPVIGTLPPISRDPAQNDNASAISGGIAGISGARIARVDQVVSLADIGDGLHPNDNGQAQIARAFAGQIY